MQPNDFDPFTLSASAHSGPKDGMCVMEMVSFLAGEEWSDMPVCSSPVISRFCQKINDRFGQDFRDKLQDYVPRLIGTASVGHDLERAEYLAWAAVRTFAPMALRARGLHDWADKLASFQGSLSEAGDLCSEVAKKSDASAAAYASASAAASAAAYASAYAYASAAAYAAAAASAAAAADYAADYAGVAASAAAAAAAAAAGVAAAGAKDVHAEVFKVLDGLLDIGPSGSAYTQEHLERVEPLRKAMASSC